MKANLIGFSLLLAAGCGSNSTAEVDTFIGQLATQHHNRDQRHRAERMQDKQFLQGVQ